jgi:hypothetical protein
LNCTPDVCPDEQGACADLLADYAWWPKRIIVIAHLTVMQFEIVATMVATIPTMRLATIPATNAAIILATKFATMYAFALI